MNQWKHSIQSDSEIKKIISPGIFLVSGYKKKVIVTNIVQINARGASIFIINYLRLKRYRRLRSRDVVIMLTPIRYNLKYNLE